MSRADPIKHDTIEAKKGTYRAYGRDGTVIWEMPKFIVGVDSVPPGIREGMVAMQITGAGGKVVAQWDPEHTFA